ncbi:LysR family transcriptional regulator [Roseibium aggregatum]|uniref:LysR family transcriptional regulator n=1 Tax=Roseibium aggregatum TaxID=187304 RepID=A0A939J5I9_9HYPH|nr:LysR family transcriptional regulator [Roseibium aggregatum]MBN9671774.1 LysR family transcriptional regulator [Roseibium aggregatum]
MTALSHLETFIEVAASGSFAGASRHLGLPRSTVTARIKSLEEELGVALFQRTTRQVRLTPEGESYLSKVQPAMVELKEAGEQLKSALAPQGLVRLSVPVDLPLDKMADAMTSFNARYPDVRIEVHISDRPVDLTGERFDFALRGNRAASENVVVRKIASSPLLPVARPELLAGASFDALLAEGRVLDPAGAMGETECSGSTAVFRTRNLQLVRALVLTGSVAAVLPRSMCEDLLETGELVETGYPAPLPDLSLYAVLPSRRFVPKRVRLLVDHLAKVFR